MGFIINDTFPVLLNNISGKSRLVRLIIPHSSARTIDVQTEDFSGLIQNKLVTSYSVVKESVSPSQMLWDEHPIDTTLIERSLQSIIA